MRSILNSPRFGIGLMLLSPLLALSWGSEVFFPVAAASLLGGLACFGGRSLCTQMNVGQITAELVQELVCATERDRKAVLASLSRREREWFLVELPQAAAELRRRNWKPRAGACASVNWRWRLRLATRTASAARSPLLTKGTLLQSNPFWLLSLSIEMNNQMVTP
jgi:hypothetical protein